MTVWYDAAHEAVVVKMRLPSAVAEAVTPNEDGTCTVIINESISEEAARRAYAHALSHIRRGDFAEEDVDMVERRAHESA